MRSSSFFRKRSKISMKTCFWDSEVGLCWEATQFQTSERPSLDGRGNDMPANYGMTYYIIKFKPSRNPMFWQTLLFSQAPSLDRTPTILPGKKSYGSPCLSKMLPSSLFVTIMMRQSFLTNQVKPAQKKDQLMNCHVSQSIQSYFYHKHAEFLSASMTTETCRGTCLFFKLCRFDSEIQRMTRQLWTLPASSNHQISFIIWTPATMVSKSPWTAWLEPLGRRQTEVRSVLFGHQAHLPGMPSVGHLWIQMFDIFQSKN